MSTSPSNYTPRPMSSKTTYALGAVALVLIGLLVFLAYRWMDDEAEIRNDGYGTVRDAAVVTAVQPDGAIVLGRPGVTKIIDVFEDPLCPGCGALEHIFGQEIAQKLDEGKLAIRYRFVNFLDDKSGSGDYSTRAIAALQCVAADGSGPTYAAFHDALFTTRQPKEGGSDLSNDDLAALARDTGATPAAADCITTGARLDAAKINAVTADADLTTLLDDDAATPSVFDGTTKIDVGNQDWVADLAP
ncbi:DsbA family protein [Nocardia cyriacigeorgica]|uniref:DsbA family protein n=1 Tax=Nocardia cyriacigeorgica TaxID=135487 RepID=UPI002B4B3EA6|nr:thioredoxin domain-containing protein [Nocardia cyriacigeorgica]